MTTRTLRSSSCFAYSRRQPGHSKFCTHLLQICTRVYIFIAPRYLAQRRLSGSGGNLTTAVRLLTRGRVEISRSVHLTPFTFAKIHPLKEPLARKSVGCSGHGSGVPHRVAGAGGVMTSDRPTAAELNEARASRYILWG